MSTNNQISSYRITDLIHNSFYVGIGRVLGQIFNLLVFPLVLRFITPATYGIYSLLDTTALICGVVISFGISAVFFANFQEATTKPKGIEILLGRCLSQQMMLGGIVLSIIILFSNQITIWVVKENAAVIFALLLFREYIENHNLIFSRWQMLTSRQWQISITSLLRAVNYLGFSFYFVSGLKLSILGLALAYVLSDLIVLCLNLYFSRGQIVLQPPWVKITETIRLGLPAMPENLFFWVIISAPVYYLRMWGFTDTAGQFSLAWRLASSLDALGNSLTNGAARPLMKSTMESISPELKKIFRFSLVILLLGFLGIGIFGPEFLRYFFSNQYQSSVLLLPFCILGFFFLSMYYFEWIGINASKKTIGLSIASGSGALISFLFFQIIGKNITGLLASAIFASAFLVMWLVARKMRPGMRFGNFIKLLVSSVLMSLLIIGVNRIPINENWLLAVKILLFFGVAFVLGLFLLYSLALERGNFHIWDIPTYSLVGKLISGNRRVLDLGCSEGFFLSELDADLKVGVDIDFPRLLFGKKCTDTINFVCADAENLPFKTDSFDGIVLIGSLPYLKSPEKVVKSLSKLVVRGGDLVISTASNYPVYLLLNIYRLKIRIYLYKKNELEKLVNSNGFQKKQILEKGLIIAPILSSLYAIPSYFDQHIIKSKSVLGPLGRKARWITDPLIDWEFKTFEHPGYQWFVHARKENND